MKPNQIFSTLLVIALFLSLPIIGYTQGDDPPGPTGCTDPGNPIPCPIDGGVSLLIAAGIGLGAKKAYQERIKKNAVTENAAN
jgi:hypothetical protein